MKSTNHGRYQHIKACVQYSGGLMSFGAAKLTVDKYGAENVLLLFADTGVESPGTYAFIVQGAAALGCELVTVSQRMRKARNSRRGTLLKNINSYPTGECLFAPPS